MERIYTATAYLADGTTLTTEGTIAECADWCETVNLEHGGEITCVCTEKPEASGGAA